MANISLGQLRDLWKTVADWVTGTSISIPKVKDADVKSALDTLNQKDFATDTNLAAVLDELNALKSEVAIIKANQLSGDQKVQLSGNDVVIGLLADRPTASEMRGRGYYAWDETDGHKLKYSDGTDWVVNQ